MAAHNVARFGARQARHSRRRAGRFHAAPGNQLTHVPGLPLGTRGGILAKVDLPADGEYRINIADMATHIWGNGMEYENPLVVTVDNKIVYQTVIGGEEDMKLYDQVQSGAMDRVNARLKNIKFQTTAGPHNIGVTFRRQSFAESDDQLQIFAPGGGQDRSYRVNSFQLLGPFDVTGLSSTPSRDRIFTCNPAKDKNKTPEACAKADFLDAGQARLSPSGNERRHRGPHAVLRRWRETGRFRIWHSRRNHGNAGQPVLPVSRRARSRRVEAGRQVPDHRSRTRIEAFVLPVELHSRR